ncbi:jg20905 [Pararge aegeria aegeria]|uniref:Jg20905 protein n=1 Tax=Pararge aegeria aegeria TaxID=348720 RepID=A0A8S4RJB4_9NEOP|nr:jg20905 [Pararge aegeria aegeria]
MDRNGYFFYVASTAKKKKISLMQPKPPRMAFEEKRRPGVAERLHSSPFSHSVASAATENGRGDSMSQRAGSDAPRARLYTQLESYQPRYHTIRESGDKRVESECKKRVRNEQRKAGYQSVSNNILSPAHYHPITGPLQGTGLLFRSAVNTWHINPRRCSNAG